MRTPVPLLALFLGLLLVAALSPSLVLAAERETPQAPPIVFQDEEEADEEEKTDPNTVELPPPDDQPGGEVSDAVGNFQLTYPAGWTPAADPPEEEDLPVRVELLRATPRMGGAIGSVIVFRYRIGNVRIFEGTPGEALELLERELKFWDPIYGENATAYVRPELDGSRTLGSLDADKSIGFHIASLTLDEQKELAEIERRIRSGDKTVKRPDWADHPIITRGRIGMISPYVYVVRVQTARFFGKHPALNAEIDAIIDSFRFLDTGARQPALNLAGERIGDTYSDPELEGERKIEVPHSETKRQTYEFELSFKLPPGWGAITEREKIGNPQVSTVVYAQDADNNWLRITFAHICIRELGGRSLAPPEQQCTEWKTNWEGQAVRTEFPRKEDKFSIGAFRGKGWKEVTGQIAGFPVQFRALCADEGAFRHLIEMEMRASSDDARKRFEKELRSFEKSIRIRD